MSKNQVKIISTHQIEAEVPVHLIEMELVGDIHGFNFDEVTQAVIDQPQGNWQVAYDEKEIESPNSNKRFAFFFHFLDLDAPLLTSFGDVEIPTPSQLPGHLKAIEYLAP